jgi:hypothetical protein
METEEHNKVIVINLWEMDTVKNVLLRILDYYEKINKDLRYYPPHFRIESSPGIVPNGNEIRLTWYTERKEKSNGPLSNPQEKLS